jgi:hypothetical protein
VRLLCDQNVAERYVTALASTPDFCVANVRDTLDPRASDPDIAAYAAAEGYVVFTSDDDFFRLAADCGRVYYQQAAQPPVGDVRTALRAIRDAYADTSEILEVVPGGWV